MYNTYNTTTYDRVVLREIKKSIDTIKYYKQQYDIEYKFDNISCESYADIKKYLGENIELLDDDVVLFNNNNYYNVSCGQKQIASIINIIQQDKNDCIIIDEPLTSVDVADIRKICSRCCRSGKQLIFTTHNSSWIDIDTTNNLMFINNGNLSIINKKYSKILFEHPELLFYKKYLLCEGYDDAKVLKYILRYISKINNIDDDYCIITKGGTKNKRIIEFLNEYRLQYVDICDSDISFVDTNSDIYDKEFAEYIKKEAINLHKIILDNVPIGNMIYTFTEQKQNITMCNNKLRDALINAYRKKDDTSKCFEEYAKHIKALKTNEECDEKICDEFISTIRENIYTKFNNSTIIGNDINMTIRQIFDDCEQIITKYYLDEYMGIRITPILLCGMLPNIYLNIENLKKCFGDNLFDIKDVKKYYEQISEDIEKNIMYRQVKELCEIYDNLLEVIGTYISFNEKIMKTENINQEFVNNLYNQLVRFKLHIFEKNKDHKFYWQPNILCIEGFDLLLNNKIEHNCIDDICESLIECKDESTLQISLQPFKHLKI